MATLTLTVPVIWPVIYHRSALFLCFGFGLTYCCRVRLGLLQLLACCGATSILHSQQSPPAGINNIARKSFLFLGMGRAKATAWLSAFLWKMSGINLWFKLHHTPIGTYVGGDILETVFKGGRDQVYWCVDYSTPVKVSTSHWVCLYTLRIASL